MSSTNSLIDSSAAGTGTRTATPSAMVVTAARRCRAGRQPGADGSCRSQVDVLVKHCATLSLHAVKERFGSTGSAPVLSLPAVRRCHGVATSLDYQNATLKIVSGRLGSPSGHSGRLRE